MTDWVSIQIGGETSSFVMACGDLACLISHSPAARDLARVEAGPVIEWVFAPPEKEESTS